MTPPPPPAHLRSALLFGNAALAYALAFRLVTGPYPPPFLILTVGAATTVGWVQGPRLRRQVQDRPEAGHRCAIVGMQVTAYAYLLGSSVTLLSDWLGPYPLGFSLPDALLITSFASLFVLLPALPFGMIAGALFHRLETHAAERASSIIVHFKKQSTSS